MRRSTGAPDIAPAAYCASRCATRADQVIGVTQVLNKRSGAFTAVDMALLEAISRHAASALEQAQMMERLEQARREELELLQITEAISTELHIDTLLARIVAAATQLLDAERSTLFVYDPAKDELWSKVAEGTEQKQIRIPAAAGVAGAAFTSGDVLDIPDAYADPRFNREIDRTSGFRTRNLLNVPVIDRTGERLGVVQVLNKRGGPFTQVDIRRLKAFSAGIAVALENARLFSDVLALKNYNENILKSLSNGVVTLDRQCVIVKVNEAAQRILGLSAAALVDRSAQHAFGNLNAWITRSLDFVARMGATDYHAGTDLKLPDGGVASVNLTAAPFLDTEGTSIGYMCWCSRTSPAKNACATRWHATSQRRSSIGCSRAATMSSKEAPLSPPSCSPTSGASRCCPTQ